MRQALLWLLGGAGLVWLVSQRDAVQGVVETGADAVQAAVSGWQTVQDGPQWVPILNVAEVQNGLPPNLLARMAYQESHFRPEIIDGSKASAAGALGILQLMPKYFPSVRVARPFTPQDTGAQIQEAAGELARLYQHFQDWGLSLAAYNDGQGNVNQYVAGNRALPAETVRYVSDILTDVPLSGATIPA